MGPSAIAVDLRKPSRDRIVTDRPKPRAGSGRSLEPGREATRPKHLIPPESSKVTIAIDFARNDVRPE